MNTSSRAMTSQNTNQTHSTLLQRVWLGISTLILLLCAITGFVATFAGIMLFQPTLSDIVYEVVETDRPLTAEGPLGPDAALAPLSPVFTPEVQYWEPLIKAWGVVYQIDPNLIATVIQIESCGDPQVASIAGAQGLFQVMPFHFAAGEDMLDVQTNAQRGLNYLLGGLERSEGHVGLALAGYNGGHGIIDRGWANWTSETRQYYYWGSRIYAEAISGLPDSPTLQEWLDAGGSRLCNQASARQMMIETEQARSSS